eukprot:4976377-Amphidinium_carterae.1
MPAFLTPAFVAACEGDSDFWAAFSHRAVHACKQCRMNKEAVVGAVPQVRHTSAPAIWKTKQASHTHRVIVCAAPTFTQSQVARGNFQPDNHQVMCVTLVCAGTSATTTKSES